jgi:hypothetical protein
MTRLCRRARRVGKAHGRNREVKEEGSWGKYGFPHGREPQATDTLGATSEIVDFLRGKIPV